METRKAGYRLENSLNQWVLKVLLDNAGNEHDINAAAGTVAGIQAAIKARQELVTDGYIPDTLVTHPVATGYFLKDFVGFQTSEAMAYIANARLPKVLGCQLYECGVSLTTTTSPTASASYVWGCPTDSYIGAVMYDSKNAGYLGIRQDVQIEEMRDPIRDLRNFCMTLRIAAQYGVADSICRIEYGGA
jgi:hypothetical protein